MGILGGFASGRRFSDAINQPPATAPSGAGSRNWPALALILLALLLSTCALAESGAETYKARCSACHGANGAGDTMLGRNMKLRPLGSNEVQSQSDDELAAIT